MHSCASIMPIPIRMLFTRVCHRAALHDPVQTLWHNSAHTEIAAPPAAPARFKTHKAVNKHWPTSQELWPSFKGSPHETTLTTYICPSIEKGAHNFWPPIASQSIYYTNAHRARACTHCYSYGVLGCGGDPWLQSQIVNNHDCCCSLDYTGPRGEGQSRGEGCRRQVWR